MGRSKLCAVLYGAQQVQAWRVSEVCLTAQYSMGERRFCALNARPAAFHTERCCSDRHV